MSIQSLTGQDVIKVDDRILNDLAQGNCVEISYPDKLADVETGKNGNSIFGANTKGLNVEVKIRLVRGSSDDKYFASRMADQINDFSAFTTLKGQFIKRVGDGQGNLTSDIYQLSGGIFSKQPGAMTNAAGDVEQSVTVYELKFANGTRNIA